MRVKRKRIDPLLQSYLLALLSLVLCCAMFLSVTMAWFTSEVTTNGNKIYVGRLDVDLRDGEGKSLHGQSGSLFTNVSAWEPGATAKQTLQVVNEGDLPFKYQLTLSASTEENGTYTEVTELSEEMEAVTDQFLVSVREVKPEATGLLTGEETEPEWDNQWSLTEVLNGQVLFSGEMKGNEDETYVYEVSLHLSTEATNTIMGQTLYLNAKLVASQLAAEE